MSASLLCFHYPSDLSDEQWQFIQHLIPPARPGGRKRRVCPRRLLEAILYLNRTGCAWRYLPRHFPPWQTVYGYFSRWKECGFFQSLHEALARRERKNQGRPEVPQVLIIDSQSIRAAQGEDRGYDGFKRLRGRKRQILVDTRGLLHGVRVQPANRPDTWGGWEVLQRYPWRKKQRLQVIYADRGYRGTFVQTVEEHLQRVQLRIPSSWKNSGQGKKKLTRDKKRDKKRRRKIPKKRWVVERTFAWMNAYRRLSKDYERKTSSSECMIYLSMIQLLLRRIFSS